MFAEEADVSNAGKTKPEERIIGIVSKDKEAKNSRPPFKNVRPFMSSQHNLTMTTLWNNTEYEQKMIKYKSILQDIATPPPFSWSNSDGRDESYTRCVI